MRHLQYRGVLITLFLIIFFSPVVRAEWLFDGKAANNTSYAKTDEEFGAMLVFTDKPNQLFDAWNKEGLTVKGSFVDKIRKNKILVALIIFSNCAADDKGMGNVSVKFKLFDPNGKLMKETGELEVWINKPIPEYRLLEMSVQYLDLKVNKKGPTGTYIVEALVTDKNSGKKLKLERQFEVF